MVEKDEPVDKAFDISQFGRSQCQKKCLDHSNRTCSSDFGYKNMLNVKIQKFVRKCFPL